MRRLFTVLELQSGFHNLGERDGVARAALTLITEVRGEIVATVVTPIQRFGQISVRNIVSIVVGLLELLSFGKGTLEFFVTFLAKVVLFILIKTLESCCKILHVEVIEEALGASLSKVHLSIIAVITIVSVGPLILAGIGLPTEVSGVNGLDHQVHLITGSVLKMHVDSFLGSLTSDVLIFFVSRTIIKERLSQVIGG